MLERDVRHSISYFLFSCLLSTMNNENCDMYLDISQEDLRHIELMEARIFREIEERCSEQNSADESDDQIICPPKRRARIVIASESESDQDSVEYMVRRKIAVFRNISNRRWCEPKGHQPSVIAFTEPTGMKEPFASQLRNSLPGKYFSLVVPDTIFEDIARQTNLFTEQTGQSSKPKSRSHSWKPTTTTEIKQVFGLILYMGIVKLPKIVDYWSKDKIFGQTFPRTVMSRNRFELILKNLYYTNNETANKLDRINKIRPLVDALNETFQKYYAPKEDVCVDESQVPFRGRIIFRQYNKGKRHKYGMKLFKLCTLPGYTFRLQLYAGKNHELLNTSATKVVMGLCEGLLNLGHTVSTDNWYTNLELANQLLDHDTHLVGTLRKNQKGLPKHVIEAKLRPGEVIARENERGICVLKWKDKRDVLMLSTKHSMGFKTVVKKGRVVRKPKMVCAYNMAKGSVDLSDQMNAYSSPLRKSVKWYKKLGIELILNTALINSWVMFCENNKINISIVEFRRQLVEDLTEPENKTVEMIERPKRFKHILTKKEGSVRNTRRFCNECYKINVKLYGSKLARNKTKKVPTFCNKCENRPHLCLHCFNKLHNK